MKSTFIVSPDYRKKGKYNVYCVLDIETTGTSYKTSEITEISIHKYRNGKRVDKYHSFVKISRPLPPFIRIFTPHITDELLAREGKDLDVVIKEVKDFTKGSILVAHNGVTFDLLFLKAACIKYGLKPLSNPIIDTLRLSRSTFPNERYHTLGDVCRRMQVNYDEDRAHSADYDVDVLWQVFWNFAVGLKKIGVNLEDGLQEANEAIFNMFKKTKSS
ncbi:DNA polymerase III, alpha subunit, Gram-positive type (fragment) [Mycoplasma haemofelis str. Langford 1]|uniref:DNA polymerase III, polC-type n=2 Tax=Mycoplasma haemofelis TaxID=29501 RepID=F6FFY9_MYCHI